MEYVCRSCHLTLFLSVHCVFATVLTRWFVRAWTMSPAPYAPPWCLWRARRLLGSVLSCAPSFSTCDHPLPHSPFPSSSLNYVHSNSTPLLSPGPPGMSFGICSLQSQLLPPLQTSSPTGQLPGSALFFPELLVHLFMTTPSI